MEIPTNMNFSIEDEQVVAQIKALFAPDGGAEREHNATDGTLGFGLIHYGFVRNLKPARALGMTTIKVNEPESALIELERALGFNLRG